MRQPRGGTNDRTSAGVSVSPASVLSEKVTKLLLRSACGEDARGR